MLPKLHPPLEIVRRLADALSLRLSLPEYGAVFHSGLILVHPTYHKGRHVAARRIPMQASGERPACAWLVSTQGK